MRVSLRYKLNRPEITTRARNEKKSEFGHFFEAVASFTRLNIGVSMVILHSRRLSFAWHHERFDKDDGLASLACRDKARSACKMCKISGIARIRLI